MTKDEFRPLYERMIEMYGKRGKKHSAEWFLQFGHLDPPEFEAMVTKVIAQYRPFGQDRWPVPGEFNHIVNPPKTAEQLDLEWAKIDPEYQ